MIQAEFEQLAGYEVRTDDYYNIIEPMYMAINVDKAEFVKMIDKKRFALKPIKAIVKEMQKVAESIKETCTHYHDYEAWDKLEELVREYKERKAWGKNVSSSISTEQRQSCYYPKKVEFFTTTTFQAVDTITLVKA